MRMVRQTCGVKPSDEVACVKLRETAVRIRGHGGCIAT